MAGLLQVCDSDGCDGAVGWVRGAMVKDPCRDGAAGCLIETP